MNTLPTYETQFNKITEAYIKGEINPMNTEFCFCGTLDKEWSFKNGGVYLRKEYGKMERALFSAFPEVRYISMTAIDVLNKDGSVCTSDFGGIQDVENYEEKLFNGMVAALEVLKQIHIERGEVIDQAPVFTKRAALVNNS